MTIPTIRTRVFEMKKELGYASVSGLARLIGMSRRNVDLIQKGKRPPHNQFIAGVYAAYPCYEFDELFYIEWDGE